MAGRKAAQRRHARFQRAQQRLHLRGQTALADNLTPFLEIIPEGRAVAGYAALPDEPPVDLVLARARARGIPTALPRVVRPHHLTLHLVTGADDELAPGSFNIPEPRADLPMIEPAQLGLVLVPGVAFDRAGRRLGNGMGFYDRLLPHAVNAVLVGICGEWMLVDEIRTAPHDVDMDAVVTEAAVYR